MPRRGLPITLDQERYWSIMLPVFRGGTRLQASLAALRRSIGSALHLADRASVDELASRLERLEGRIARLPRPRGGRGA